MTDGPAQTAYETLREVAELLPTATAEQREVLLQLHRQTVALLEASGRCRLSSSALAARVAQIERTLPDRSPAERRRVVCSRLGIGKTRYYQLKKIPQKSEPNAWLNSRHG